MLSALLFYLASPHQLWGTLSVRPRILGWIAAALLIAGIALLLQWSGRATTIFIAMTLAMTVWSVIPLALAWWRGVPEGKK